MIAERAYHRETEGCGIERERRALRIATAMRPRKRWSKALCDKTIVLRVSIADRERWAIAAQRENRSVSAMIRRAVRRYVYPFSDLIRNGSPRK